MPADALVPALATLEACALRTPVPVIPDEILPDPDADAACAVSAPVPVELLLPLLLTVLSCAAGVPVPVELLVPLALTAAACAVSVPVLPANFLNVAVPRTEELPG